MNYLVVIRSRHDYTTSGEDFGYEITTVHCATERAAMKLVDWLKHNTQENYVRTTVIEDAASER